MKESKVDVISKESKHIKLKMHKCKLCVDFQNNYTYVQSEEHAVKVIPVKITVSQAWARGCSISACRNMFPDTT